MASAPQRTQVSAHERLRLIGQIAAGLHAEDSIDAMLQRAADAIHAQLGFPNVDIPLIDPDDPEMLLIRVRGGRCKERIRHEDRIPIARGVMGAAVRERRSQRIDDVRADPRYVCPPGVTGARAELAVPIRQGEQVLGVINVEGEQPFDDLDQLSLEIVADFLGVAIHNAQLIPQARESAVLSERQRLARELHDNVTQILSSISLLTQTLSVAWQRDPAEGARRVQRLQQLAQTGFAEMRMLLRELAPPATAQPANTESRRTRTFAGLELLKEHALPGALQRLLEVMAPEKLQVRLDFAAYLPQRLGNEETLYRVCQEAVSNAVRHAHTRQLWISAAVVNTHAVLQVADAGRGLGSEFRPGLGLSGMRTRLENAGGNLRVTANTPRGTLIEARLPRADRPAP